MGREPAFWIRKSGGFGLVMGKTNLWILVWGLDLIIVEWFEFGLGLNLDLNLI
jgi:hypothetical protein